MNIFSKITTSKADPLQALKSAINTAIENAIAAKIPLGLIARELKGRGSHFQRMVDDAIQQRRDNPSPAVYQATASGIKEIDPAEQAKQEEARIARKLREEQAAYAKSVDERGRDAARRQGKIL